MVHKRVLEKQSEYFATCMKTRYTESSGIIQFDDIEPHYLAYFIGVAYTNSSIIPVTPPVPACSPEASAPGNPLKLLVEVYKLCDRFICKEMSDYMVQYIKTSIGDNHRALFRSRADQGLQLGLTRDFAEGFEALERSHPVQDELACTMIRYFCEGACFKAWHKWVESNKGQLHRFLGAVSVHWAMKLDEKSKGKRKELKGP